MGDSCYITRMDDKHYHAIADATLMHFFDQLDDAYDKGSLDELELEGGVLMIKTMTGRSFVLSKHAPSLQLWFASPISGGLHFRFNEAERFWALPDGRTLYDVVRDDLKHEGVVVVL